MCSSQNLFVNHSTLTTRSNSIPGRTIPTISSRRATTIAAFSCPTSCPAEPFSREATSRCAPASFWRATRRKRTNGIASWPAFSSIQPRLSSSFPFSPLFDRSYIEVIHKILKPGGYWINLGPLLYHWQCTEDITMEEMDERYEQSFEISFEEIEEAMKRKGFKFEETRRVCTPYADNMWGRWGDVTCRRSMMMTLFRGVFFVAKKEEEASRE